jgi:integrase
LALEVSPRDVKVAPNIYRSRNGWRVYVRRNGRLTPFRFKAENTLEQLQEFIATYRAKSAELKQQQKAAAKERAGTLAGDAARYLRLKVVQAMPSVDDRARDIAKWVAAFGRRARSSLTTRDIDEQLQAWFDEGYAGSTVNKFRTALMSLYTRLDGRSAANPVKDTRAFEEAEEMPRAQEYALLERILTEIPTHRSRPVKGKKGSRKRGSPSRARIEVMLWTGMAPSQVMRLTPAHVHLRERWYISPRREKGTRDRRSPRPIVKKPMTTRAYQAFKRFAAVKAYGPFDRRSLRHTWLRAVRRTERALRKEQKNPKLKLPHIRLYDIRHSFGTRLFKATKNLRLVGEMLDHSSDRTTRRYALGAVPEVLLDGMRQFEEADGG